jgi:hypothetical protein
MCNPVLPKGCSKAYEQAGVKLVHEIQTTFRAGLSAAGATAQALGVQRVIAKPLSRAELLEAVRAMISAPN